MYLTSVTITTILVYIVLLLQLSGYPEIDYINGIPRKTQLCLSYDVNKFHSYMLSLYPKLDGRLYDMYRIDKTRRLIRVEAKSPRQLKDMKYQGSLIVIPYVSEFSSRTYNNIALYFI